MYGSHLSISDGLGAAADRAAELGFETVQIFTKNQQQWKAKPLAKEAIAGWRAAIDRLGWHGRAVSHASYLANLASPNDELWEKSTALMREEMDRCEALGVPFLVHHPGAYTTSSLEEGQTRIAKAYAALLTRDSGAVVLCLEGTAGGDSHIGGRFEHLARLFELIADACGKPERVGFCLDTCHLHAAGYDMSTRASADAVLDEFDRVCGLSRLRVLHVNDSKGKLGSHLDRHEHIGEGWVGGGAKAHAGTGTYSLARLRASGFSEIVNRPELANIPKILETPKGQNEKGVEFDSINLKRLHAIAQ